MRHSAKRTRLSPVLADEPLIGQDLTRRLRVILVSVVIAFVLTNLTSYLIGQAVAAEAERDMRNRVAALERQFAADLDARRADRDAEIARQDAELRQLREDACVLADRVQPRDAVVQRLRKRYGCTDTPPAVTPSGTPGTSGAPRDRPPNGANPEPNGPPAAGGPQPPRPAPRPSPAPPSPTPPPPVPDPDDGLICLPVLGCVL